MNALFALLVLASGPLDLDKRTQLRAYPAGDARVVVEHRADMVAIRASVEVAWRAAGALNADLRRARPGVWLLEFEPNARAFDALSKVQGVRAAWPVLKRGTAWALATDELTVKSHLPIEEVSARLSSKGVDFMRETRVPGTALFRAGAAHHFDAIEAIASIDDDALTMEPVIFREMSLRATVDDPLHNTQWHLARDPAVEVPGDASIDVHSAWDVTLGDASVIVAVVDTGTDLQHEDLVDAIVGGFDVIDDDDDASAECDASFDGAQEAPSCPPAAPFRESHGTAVSGAAVARGNNGIGLSGVCPLCSLIPVRFIGADLTSSVEIGEVFIRLADEGAAVINNSWGPNTSRFFPLSGAERDAIDYALREGRGGLGTMVFFAAGNSTADTQGDPYAGHPEVMTIAASTNLDDWAFYSNFGATIDVAAPSLGGITDADNFGIATTDFSGPEGYDAGDYAPAFSGTSAASPIAAGLAALIISAEPSLTHEQVRLLMTSTAVQIRADVIPWEQVFNTDIEAAFEYDEDGHSIGFGFGRIDAGAALLASTDVEGALGLQGALCTDACARCAADGTCELACETTADCVRGSVCNDDGEVSACSAPRPPRGSVGEPCSEDCELCVSALDSGFELSSICTASCETGEDCPTGMSCREVEPEVNICVVGSSRAGNRDFYRECFFSAVVRDEGGRGYCSDTCFNDELGECPYGFSCANADCVCVEERNFGCAKFECTRAAQGDQLCFPDPGFGVTCDVDDDCSPGAYCGPEGECRTDDREGCTVCQDCLTSADCGPLEGCARFIEELPGFCTRGCETDDDCPGNAVCGEAPLGRRGSLLKTCRAPQDDPEALQCSRRFSCEVACRDDLPCQDGEVCDEGTCVAAPRPAEPEFNNPRVSGGGIFSCAQSSVTSPLLWVVLVAFGFRARRRRRQGDRNSDTRHRCPRPAVRPR